METLERLKTKLSGIKHNALGEEKVLIISDLHIPFHREQMIVDIILKHRHEISTIIFAGDIIDCESVSKFSKEIRRPLSYEMATAYKFFHRIDKLTPEVKKILIWGNHEYRFVKYLADNHNELNEFHSDNILENIVNGFVHHDRLNRKKTIFPPLSSNFKVVNKWYVQYNDLLVAHPKNYSKIHLRTAINTVEHFLKRGFRFNALFIGHTHKWGDTVHFSVWCGELGCTCMDMEYADVGNTNYTPQQYGYAIIAFNNGVTDINESRLFRVLVKEEGDDGWQEEIADLN